MVSIIDGKPVSKYAWFDQIAKVGERTVGHPLAFIVAIAMLVLWLASGPFFGFSDTWQLIINTTTTIVTFLMVFLIQNTQNRSTAGLHLKLDEVIRSTGGAYNVLLKSDELSLEEIERLRAQYDQLALNARAKLTSGKVDRGTPEVDIR